MLNFYKLTLLIFIVLFLTFSTNAEAFELKNVKSKKISFLTEKIIRKEPKISEKIWKISVENANRILSIGVNRTVQLNNFPLNAIATNSTSALSSVDLKRYNIFAPSAHVYFVTKSGKHPVELPELYTYISAEGGIGLMINPRNGVTSGYYNKEGVSLEIKGNIHTSLKVSFVQENTQDANVLRQCSMKIEDQPGNPYADINDSMTSVRNKTLMKVIGLPTYQAIVAVDTNNEWMLGKSNNTTTAMNYITNLFVNMNVYFERDFSTRLLIGDVFLRTSSDSFPTQTSINAELSDFGSYWLTNNNSLNRSFALLLSGQNIPNNSFSGIAWLNQYCQNGFSIGGGQIAGSYSVNRIGTSLSVAFVSQFVAHELGHNFGSPHTHCYNSTNTPGISSPVDTCFNGEAGCYTGAVSCPAVTGKGTIMSYCHLGGTNGANCGISNENFHPTVITFLNSKIVNNSPSCIAPFANDSIFNNGFE